MASTRVHVILEEILRSLSKLKISRYMPNSGTSTKALINSRVNTALQDFVFLAMDLHAVELNNLELEVQIVHFNKSRILKVAVSYIFPF